MGPTQPASQAIHAEKYRGRGESFREGVGRQASALSDNDQHYQVLRDILMDMRFLPAGRVQSAMGSTRCVTPYNCYVSGVIEDSFVEGHGSIMARAVEAAATMRQGGGIGYDFSSLRPRGALIKKLQSNSTGPVAFMDIFDATCRATNSSGHRRGAQMGVLRVDHPDIEEFIRAKQPSEEMQRLWDLVASIEDDGERAAAHAALQSTLKLTGFNVSVAVTDEFMQAVKDGKDFDLRWGGSTYKTVDARALWDMIMRSTWDWAEPGVLFIDRINQMNNLWYCETIAATNPCGEQPLPPYGACLLGSFNLVKYVRGGVRDLTGHMHGRWFDINQLLDDVGPVIRAMDNVVDRARYPLFEQEKEAKNKRRMGIGVTGLANALEACGHTYGSRDFLNVQEQILSLLTNQCYRASVELAKEKGSFPLYHSSKYAESKFIKTLDPDVQRDIHHYGIRNSHLTSIAPTGTISFTADCVSSSIEPPFAYEFQRKVRAADGDVVHDCTDYAYRVWGVKGKTTADVTVDEHVNVLLAAQKYVDSAVSKTCNLAPGASWDEFKSVYMKAYDGGAKGCTTFRPDGKRMGIIKVKPVEETSCTIDEAGRRSCE
jgi:ribonucleoside-diphosphate reductase alpha chain